MAALLPIFCFLLLYVNFRILNQFSWRESFLFAAVVWGFFVVIFTECLSIIKSLEYWRLLCSWGFLFFLLIIRLVLALKKGNAPRINFKFHLDFSITETIFLVILILLISYLGLIASIAPPNTWDAMTYHMGRIIHWMQNRSVAFYPTSILRQLHQAPWSEYAILQFQILSNGDHFANLIQWFSMLGSVIGVSLIAHRFNASLRGQLFSGILCATIPMGILQSTSTQTDYVVTFWLICFVYFSLQYLLKYRTVHIIAAGIALGLGILTKATAYVYALPFVIWLGINLLRKLNKKRFIDILLAMLVCLSLNLGQFIRNYDLYKNPLGPGEESPAYYYSNRDFRPAALTSNLIRNIGLHFGTPDERINGYLTKGVNRFHKLMGISPTEELTTWPGMKFKVEITSFNEDSAGNFLHLLLIMIVIPFFAFQRDKENDVQLYISALIVGFYIFCSLLRWQPWNSRLHLPAFVLFSPCIGIWMSRIKGKWISTALLAIMILAATPWLLLNSSKPILGDNNIFLETRTDQYFRQQPGVEETYSHATKDLMAHHCTNIGLILGVDDWEYPLWALLHAETPERIYFQHVNLTNISKDLPVEWELNPEPLCAIFTKNSSPEEVIAINNSQYYLDWSSASYHLYFTNPTPHTFVSYDSGS